MLGKSRGDSLLSFKENGYLTRIINPNDPDDVWQYQYLRYRIKVVKLKWITAPTPNVPIAYDKYDSHSIHFGVFDSNNELKAYSRLILPINAYEMQLFDEFSSLLDPKQAPSWSPDHSAEVSSLVIDDTLKCMNNLRYGAAQNLYKIMAQWSVINKRQFWYAISEKKFLRALRFQGFPFKIIGAGKHFQGATTYPAALDLEEGYAGLLRIDRGVYNWFIEGLDFKGKGDPPRIL